MRSSLYCILLGDDEYSVDYDNFSDNGDDLFNSIVVSLDSYGITIIFVPIKKKKNVVRVRPMKLIKWEDAIQLIKRDKTIRRCNSCTEMGICNFLFTFITQNYILMLVVHIQCVSYHLTQFCHLSKLS